jgi:hypothetical protein
VIIEQHIRLLGTKNPGNCLPGYLVHLYSSKEVFTKKKANAYRLAKRGGDLDNKDKAEDTSEEEEEPEEQGQE